MTAATGPIAPPTRLLAPPAPAAHGPAAPVDRTAPAAASSGAVPQRPFGAWLRESQLQHASRQAPASQAAPAAQPGNESDAAAARVRGGGESGDGANDAEASDVASGEPATDDAKTTKRPTARPRSQATGRRDANDAARPASIAIAPWREPVDRDRAAIDATMSHAGAGAVDLAPRPPPVRPDAAPVSRSQLRHATTTQAIVVSAEPAAPGPGATAGAGHVRREEPARVDSTTASPSVAAPTTAGEVNMQATPNSAVPAAYVPAPVGTPEFGASLGIQVTLFIAEGVQHAELHLNPSDMGPVSIRIALEGTATRVDFAAEQAATREAIERSLPELASALRDAGFTLSGGGVSTRHDGGGAAPDGNEEPRPGKHRADSGAAPFDAKGARRIATIKDGGIDVYA